MRSGTVKFILAASTVGFGVGVAWLLVTKHQRLNLVEKIPAVSLTELAYTKPFRATVRSTRQGRWNAVVDSSTGSPVPDSRPTDYMMVYLRKANGSELSILQENPTTNEVAFLSQLRAGREYSFPDVLVTWQQRQTKDQ